MDVLVLTASTETPPRRSRNGNVIIYRGTGSEERWMLCGEKVKLTRCERSGNNAGSQSGADEAMLHTGSIILRKKKTKEMCNELSTD